MRVSHAVIASLAIARMAFALGQGDVSAAPIISTGDAVPGIPNAVFTGLHPGTYIGEASELDGFMFFGRFRGTNAASAIGDTNNAALFYAASGSGPFTPVARIGEIGRASCRERV